MTSPNDSPASSVWNLGDHDRLAEPSQPIPELPPTISESRFHNTTPEYAPCEDPDCTLVSVEGRKFLTRKDLLGVASDTFRDMFEASDPPPSPEPQHPIELPETSHTISLMLSVVHSVPITFPQRERVKFQVGKPEPDVRREAANVPPPEGLLPFENVRELLRPLAEKYAFNAALVRALKTHLAQHIMRYPMDVYVLASALEIGALEREEQREMRLIASDASQYLHSPTLTSLPLSTARKFPSAESYAALLRLQLYRTDKLKEILRDSKTSGVFPFDYNICKDHGVMTRKVWEARKKTLQDELDAGTDLAVQMGNTVLPAVRHCDKCSQGVTAAVEMIRVSVTVCSEASIEFGMLIVVHSM